MTGESHAQNGTVRRPERVGIAVLAVVAAGTVALAADWVTGVGAVAVSALLLAAIVSIVWTAFVGGLDARRALAPYGLLKPGILWLCLFFIAPLWSMLEMSLSSKKSRFDFLPSFSWQWSNFGKALSDFGPQFGRSFGYAAAATVLTLLIGYPIAYVIAFRGGRFRSLLLGLVAVPFFTSYLIRTLAWQSLLSDRGPIVGTIDRLGLNAPLEWLHIMDNGRLMNTPAAVIGGLTYNFLPFMILPIFVSLEKVDVKLVDAAMDLYSTATGAFRKVVFPLSLPGVFAGSLLVFIPAAGDFVNAQFLGSPKTTMIGNSIQNQFLVQLNYPLASAISLVLMIVITSSVLVYARFMGTEDIA